MARYKIYTLGCRVNFYESQAIAEGLEKDGFIPAEEEEKADVCIINTCAVTQMSEKKSRQLVRRCIRENEGAEIYVTGCSSQLHPEIYEKIEGVSGVFGCRNKSELCDYITGRKKADGIIIKDSLDNGKELIPAAISHFDRVRAYVKIEDGCDGKCAYCIIAKARGRAVSRDEEEILSEIGTLAKGGCREVVLTGIETANYKPSLSGLILRVAEVEGIERIRLGSLDPAFITEKFLSEIAECKKFMPHFHLSLQSGCSQTLAAMKRKYNAEMAAEVIENIRKYFPNANLSADIICGFPGETEENFGKSLEFIKKARLLHAHIFPFSRREGTVADSMPCQLTEEQKDERCRALSSMQKEIKKEILEAYIKNNKTCEVLFETEETDFWHGHTDNFIEVSAKAKTGGDIKGKILTVEILSTDGEIIYGEIK